MSLTLADFYATPVAPGGSGGPPSGAAGGHLAGTYPNPTVPGLASLAAVDANLQNGINGLNGSLVAFDTRIDTLEAGTPAAPLRTVTAPSDDSETVIGVTSGRLDDDLVLIAPSADGVARANVKLPAASTVLGQILKLKQLPAATGAAFRMGPAVYTIADLPAFLDVTAFVNQIAVTDYTATPDEWTFNVNGAPVVVTIDEAYGDLGALFADLIAQLGGAGVVALATNHTDPRDGTVHDYALVTVATGASAALDVTALDPDPSVSGLLVANGVDGETAARVGIDGTFGKGETYTHAWPDGPAAELVMQSTEIVATTAGWQALHWTPRPEMLPITPPPGAVILAGKANVFQALDALGDGFDLMPDPTNANTPTSLATVIANLYASRNDP